MQLIARLSCSPLELQLLGTAVDLPPAHGVPESRNALELTRIVESIAEDVLGRRFMFKHAPRQNKISLQRRQVRST